ncbi:hypothetical protein ACFQZ4_00585 [Catellatospora coxensis]
MDEADLWAVTAACALPRYAALAEAQLREQATPSQLDALVGALAPLVKDPARQLSGDLGSLSVGQLDLRDAEPLRHLADVRIHLFAEHVAPGTVEEGFLAAIGSDVGAVNWDVRWPPVDELDLDDCVKYAGVEITVNSAGLFDETYAGDHTVWVHTREDERAQWLAERAGATVLGPRMLGR